METFPDTLDSVTDSGELLRQATAHFHAQTATLHMLQPNGLLHLQAAVGQLPPPSSALYGRCRLERASPA